MKEVKAFQNTVWQFYSKNGRDLPWRRPEANGVFDPYKILVSEMMLQQTQAKRVIPKYKEFLAAFPTMVVLAHAPLGRVLAVWSGLGYNRRAQYLHRAAQYICNEFEGSFPKMLNTLTKLPGVGHNTAAAILAYAYNQPVAFVETNIRTVYIHHFFREAAEKVSDAQILEHVQETLPGNAREWYWALMDYGTFLKKTQGSLLDKSKSYKRQSAFHGSSRQIRGRILRLLLGGSQTFSQLQQNIPDDRLITLLSALEQEGLIKKTKNIYHLN